ncbi:alpha/beta hydrolase [Actinocorallia aurea]
MTVPSRAHDWLTRMFLKEREEASAPTPLEVERTRMEHLATLVAVPPGVREEAVVELPGSLLLTPPDPRDDLLILFIHGGGFRVGTPGNDRAAAGLLALRTGARVLCPKYRLAPENPYPAGLDDCERAYLFACGLLPNARIVVGGGSAGAGLSAALLLRRRDAGDQRPLAGLLFSGTFDLRLEHIADVEGTWVRNAATDLVLTPEGGRTMSADYAGVGDPNDPGISPLRADLTGLPPLLIHVSGTELLFDDSLRFASRAGQAGVETVLEIWPGMHHAWQAMAGMLPEAIESVERAAEFVLRVADGRVVGGGALTDLPEVMSLLEQSDAAHP